ncbi:MFS transporter [Antribacter gilvus]|uniref:MFS transporter n=1 Tax=Antribacter gilvus TaxID=2304675 RepID=UPI000F7AB00F|nr:MFS transporter [Antribacter gilvus]
MPSPLPNRGTALPVDPRVSRARQTLMALFVLFGMIQISWMSRLPSIRESLGVSSAELGVFLIVGAVGALAAVTTAGAIITRFGNRATLVAATAGNAAGFSLLAAGTALGSVPLFLGGVLLNGICGALTNTPINLSAALVEQRLGRAILPHFHAAFSIGAGAGALVAAGFAAADVHVSVQVVIVAVLVTVARVFLVGPATALSARSGRPGTAEPSPRRGAGLRTALRAWREPRTLLIGLVLLAGSLSEGSAGNWLAIAMVDGFAVREAVGAAAYGSFVAAMTVVRLGGTRLLDRFGRVAVLRVSSVSGLVGLALFGLAPDLRWAWAGILLWGMGSALGSPVAVAAASDEPIHAAARVSVATSFSSIAQLSAPPLLGLLADGVGVRHALLVICAAMVVSLVLAGHVRPVGTARPALPDDVPATPPVAGSPDAPLAQAEADALADELRDETEHERRRVPVGV